MRVNGYSFHWGGEKLLAMDGGADCATVWTYLTQLKHTPKNGQHVGCILRIISNSMNMNLSKFQEMVKDREVWHAAVHGVTKSWTWLSDWIATTTTIKIYYLEDISYGRWNRTTPHEHEPSCHQVHLSTSWSLKKSAQLPTSPNLAMWLVDWF